MSSNPDNLENQQDQEEQGRRPVLFIPIIVIVLLCAFVSSIYAVTQGIVNIGGTQEPTQAEPTATEEETEVAEVPTRTPTFTAVPTEEPTDEPTPTATPTEEPTDEPTDEPTPTNTPTRRTVILVTPTDEPECGDLVCNGTETAATCPKDCGCFDDTICTTAETAIGTCRDCTNPGTCGAVCNTTADCQSGYSCLSTGFCDASFCRASLPTEEPPPPTDKPVTCSCVDIIEGPGCQNIAQFSCTDGTTQEQSYNCEGEQPPAGCCSCNGTTMDCAGEAYDQPEAFECVVGSPNCGCLGWQGFGQGLSTAAAQSANCSDTEEFGLAFYSCKGNENENSSSATYFMTCGEAEELGCFDSTQ